MKLTTKEKETILKLRKQEEDSKPKKSGTLKYDFYYFAERYPEIKLDISDILDIPQPKESWFTNFINWAKRYGK